MTCCQRARTAGAGQISALSNPFPSVASAATLLPGTIPGEGDIAMSEGYRARTFVPPLVAQRGHRRDAYRPLLWLGRWGSTLQGEPSLPGGIVSDQESRTHIMDAADAEGQFGALLKKVIAGRGRVVVQESGRPVAALVSEADLLRLEQLDRQRDEGWKTIQEIWARNADLDPEEVERDIAEAIAEMRAESRARSLTATSR